MQLEELQKHWDEFGKTDPLWAILTHPEKRGNQWDEDEFFATGQVEVGIVMRMVAEWAPGLAQERALDFGCGVGRLTQALCAYFDHCDGVDIAPSMIEQARAFNRYGERCAYHVNDRADLSLFPDDQFDLVLSLIVLQHIQPAYALAYVREFVRVLKPGGVVVFQLPHHDPPDPSRIAPAPVLPPTAFRADIKVLARPERLVAEAPAMVRVHLTNRSPHVWPGAASGDVPHYVALGNHWRTRQGALVTLDDGRALLTADLGPGQAVDLDLTITAPAEPGHYTLDLDVVQDQVAWFANHGSRLVSWPVQVVPPVAAAPSAPDVPPPDAAKPLEPVMEMYGVPRAEVEQLLAGAGARVLHVVAEPMVGLDWLSLIYVVRKEGVRSG